MLTPQGLAGNRCTARAGGGIADAELFQTAISFRNRWTVMVRNRSILAMGNAANPAPEKTRRTGQTGDGLTPDTRRKLRQLLVAACFVLAHVLLDRSTVAFQ